MPGGDGGRGERSSSRSPARPAGAEPPAARPLRASGRGRASADHHGGDPLAGDADPWRGKGAA
eukprot:5437250-Pyramimonas_sp.AAC.1